MLTPEQLQNLPTSLVERYSELAEFVLRDIARRIAKTSQITETAEYELIRARELGLSEKEIAAKIAEINNVAESEIDTLIRDAAAKSDEFDRAMLGDDGSGAAIPLEENEQLQQMMAAEIKNTQNACVNYTGTIGFALRDVSGRYVRRNVTDTMRKLMDDAHFKVINGTTDYNTAVRQACAALAESGLRTIYYESGHSDRIEVAVRRAVMTSVSQVTQAISEQNAEDLGADGWEISAHVGARPTHADAQGKQYKKEEYETKVKPIINDYNCRHSAFPIIYGVSEPVYTDEELEAMNKPVTYNGKSYTPYEAQQQMRKMERAMRKQKDLCITADAAGNKENFTAASIKLRRQKDIYEDFCKQTGNYTEYERTFVQGYNRHLAGKTGAVTRKQRAADRAQIKLPEFDGAHKAQGGGTIDWSKAKLQKHTQEQLSELVSYAEGKGIHIYDPKKFDGDIDILKGQIDALHDIREEYGLKSRLTLTFNRMNDDDFAQTFGGSINFNTRALRDRKITNEVLNADDWLAATDITGIAVHEAGHLIAQKYGNKGLDIAAKAYYNIYGEQISAYEIVDFLENNVSGYCCFLHPNKANKPFNSKHYQEVIPEILSKDKSNGDTFTHEFVRLLKEMIS